MVTNLVFVRKKKIKGREYYYLVRSTRKDGRVRKVEHYIGLNPPSKKDLKKYYKEFDSIKEFLCSKKEVLGKIKRDYLNKLKTGKKDELEKMGVRVFI